MTGLASSLREKIYDLIYLERERLFLWTPVFFALGIYLGDHFHAHLNFFQIQGACVASLLLLFLSYRFLGYLLQKLVFIPCLILLGLVVILWRIETTPTQILKNPLEAARIFGTVKNIEVFPNKTRLTLDKVEAISGAVSYQEELNLVRVTLRGRLQPKIDDVFIGSRVSFLGSLSPPGAPIAPQAYNFRRHAFYEGISAVGFAMTPLTVYPSKGGTSFSEQLTKIRAQVTQDLQKVLKGPAGAIAAALVTGDRSGIPENLKQAYSDAGIAHILAISGLHLSLVAGLVFLLIRGGLSLIPAIALRFNTKKIAAVVALFFTGAYLLLSGMTIPAQRAFIMTSIILLSVLVDRDAFTLRNVALAAFAILLFKPDALFTASFQLSFAAVIGLIAFYDAFEGQIQHLRRRNLNIWQKFLAYLIGLLITSLIATLATAPITVFIFNRISLAAVFANLAVIPIVSFILMPLLLFTTLLLPLTPIIDLIAPLLAHTIDLISIIALFFSDHSFWVLKVQSLPFASELLIILGLLWLALWCTKQRYLGFIAIALGIFIEGIAAKPDLYIGPKHNLVMVRSPEGVWLTNSLIKERFARENWTTLTGSPEVLKWVAQKTPRKNQKTAKSLGYFVDQDDTLHLKRQNHTIHISKEGQVRIKDQTQKSVFDSRDPQHAGPRVITFKNNNLHIE